jgi:hypothetical protein
MASTSHAGLAGYLLRSRIEPPAVRGDGAMALVFDGNVRVLCHPAARGELVAEAQLCLLDVVASRDEATMLSALREAALQAPQVPVRLVLPPDEDRLVLQATIAADASGDQFEAAMARFLDAVNAWRARFGTI